MKWERESSRDLALMEIKQRSKFGLDMRVKWPKFGRPSLEAQTQSCRVKAHTLFNSIPITGKVTICLHFTSEGFETPKDEVTWQGQGQGHPALKKVGWDTEPLVQCSFQGLFL